MAGMAFDHKLLRERIDELELTDVDDAPTLQALLYGIHALLDAHFRRKKRPTPRCSSTTQNTSTVAAIEATRWRRHERGEISRQARAQIYLGAEPSSRPVGTRREARTSPPLRRCRPRRATQPTLAVQARR